MAYYETPKKPDFVIHTGFYTAEMKQILDSLKTALERTNYAGSRAGKKLQCSEVFINPDGEVVFNLFKSTGSWRYSDYTWGRTIWKKCNLDPQKIREEIAWLFKITCHGYLAKTYGRDKVHDHWTRIDTTDLRPVFQNLTNPFTVADLYCIYELLRDRKAVTTKYTAEVVGRWRGEQRDPIMTEMEVARREQIEAFKKEAVEKENQLNRERDTAISESNARIRKEYLDKVEAMRKEYEQKIKDLDTQLAFMENLGV